ncbi:hypothetical protein D3C83_12080 [compost metagenome]
MDDDRSARPARSGHAQPAAGVEDAALLGEERVDLGELFPVAAGLFSRPARSRILGQVEREAADEAIVRAEELDR